jgi:hypothetical protein
MRLKSAGTEVCPAIKPSRLTCFLTGESKAVTFTIGPASLRNYKRLSLEHFVNELGEMSLGLMEIYDFHDSIRN